MKILYYDCFSGISGDMNLGAMIDLGVDGDYLRHELGKLEIGPYTINIQPDQRRGITGTRVDVVVDPGNQEQAHHGRTFRDIVRMIRDSPLPEAVQGMSLHIFTIIARAEAKVHGHAVEDVHFHEIGAIDSIVDIVGAAICFDCLKAERILASPVQVGGGLVRCAHGVFPVPAPATAEILKGIPLKSGLVPFETTTPTGAAILVATAAAFTEDIQFTPVKIGYGIGQRDTDVPNVLRVFLGEMSEIPAPAGDVERGEAVVLACNIDDMNPEWYDFLMELLFAQGALDVYFTPILMKKSRPAVTVSVLCDLDRQQAVEDVLWRHSSTFGLRSYRVAKAMLKREIEQVPTVFGEIAVKHGYLNGRVIKSKPEYEDCRRLAREKGLGIKDIYDHIDTERWKK